MYPLILLCIVSRRSTLSLREKRLTEWTKTLDLARTLPKKLKLSKQLTIKFKTHSKLKLTASDQLLPAQASINHLLILKTPDQVPTSNHSSSRVTLSQRTPSVLFTAPKLTVKSLLFLSPYQLASPDVKLLLMPTAVSVSIWWALLCITLIRTRTSK